MILAPAMGDDFKTMFVSFTSYALERRVYSSLHTDWYFSPTLLKNTSRQHNMKNMNTVHLCFTHTHSQMPSIGTRQYWHVLSLAREPLGCCTR